MEMKQKLPYYVAGILLMGMSGVTWANPIIVDESDSNVETSDQSDTIWHQQSMFSRVINASSVTELEEETIANVSSALSNTSLADIENDNITQTLQLRYRERKKQERIIVIQAQILHRLRMSKQPNITSAVFSEDEQKKIAMIVERMHHINNNNGGQDYGTVQGYPSQHELHTMQRLQSFYPSCSSPNNTDKTSWELPGAFRIFYDIPFNRHYLNSEVTVMLAKLRLYKITGNADPNYVGWDPNMSSFPRNNLLDSLINNQAANGINVNIYQYAKPLRLNKKEKKRLVDSRTISINYQGWVEFNVITSLNFWLHHSNRNFGFAIEVEDAYGNKLNPNLYFQNMNCSAEIAQDAPFPNIMELHPEMGENESSLFDNETYPTLDLQTAEISRDFPTFDVLSGRANERVIRKRSNRHHTRCRGEKIYVSFADVGLDEHILSPQGVHWTFCNGQCGSGRNDSPHHNFYQQFLSSWFSRHVMSSRRNSTNSSCIISRRESLPIIMYNGQNQVTETVLENLVPTECVCQAT